MQPNTINTVGTGGDVDVCTRYSEELNRSTYIAPDYTLAQKDQFSLYRTLPTARGVFLGTLKTGVKFTRGITVPGYGTDSIPTSVIMTTEFSVPVGTPDAVRIDVIKRLSSILLNDDVINGLTGRGEI